MFRFARWCREPFPDPSRGPALTGIACASQAMMAAFFGEGYGAGDGMGSSKLCQVALSHLRSSFKTQRSGQELIRGLAGEPIEKGLSGWYPLKAAMQIRPAQMKDLEREQHRKYVRGIMDLLRRDIPEAVASMPDDVFERRVRHGIECAERFGLHASENDASSRAIVLWVRLMFEVGPDFDRHPACAAILSDTATPPESRVPSLLRVASGIPWPEVAQGCNPKAWPA
jgi:hypothetical protein